jgi:rare lipoprotein A
MMRPQARGWASVVILAAVLASGCAHKKHARHVPPAPHPGAARAAAGAVETGMASWYGEPYNGRPAANGEIYNMETLVAAHRTLPFDTWVHVLNLNNEKSVDVRIIDRGPFVGNRIIDLSHAAARAIDLIGPGTAKVKLQVIRTPEHPEAALFAVQVGAFRDRANAEQTRAAMARRYGTAKLVPRPGNPDMWRVLVGAEATEDGARALAERIHQESGERSSFVVRLDS